MSQPAPQPGTPNDGQRNTRARFEQWAKNPGCDANTVSAVLGVPMRDVAKAEGATGDYGQSPFALARGQSFEDSLFRDGAQRLIAALVEAEVLLEGASGFLDLRTRRHRGTSKDLADALARTKAHLAAVAGPADRRPKQCLLAGAALHIPGDLMIPETVLILDALVIRTDGEHPLLIVGEVKTYPDRAGYTDAGELATARAQAGVYVAGLELCLKEWGIDARLQVSHRGFLVLSRSGSNMPSIRANEDLAHQRKRALRGFERLHAIAQSIPKPVLPTTGMDAIRAAPTHYCEACVAFCERAQLCRERAAGYGNPAVLGDEMEQWLGDVRLDRALALLEGAAPANPAEQDLIERFHELGARG
jgi:hypothetical protein